MPIPQAHLVLKGLVLFQRRFLYGLDQTPDERLNWSPGEAEKTPLQVAGSLARFLIFIAYTLAHRELPREGDYPPPPGTRDAAKAAIDSGCAALRRAVEGLEPADLTAKPPAPWGEDTLEEILWLINGTILYHQGQVNYIQLCYGDKDPHIPPDWREA
jgi:hypothetical protein